jgi:hypothetical protein
MLLKSVMVDFETQRGEVRPFIGHHIGCRIEDALFTMQTLGNFLEGWQFCEGKEREVTRRRVRRGRKHHLLLTV